MSPDPFCDTRGCIEKEIAEADKLLDEAETKHEETTSPLYGRIEAINQADAAAERTRRDLWDTCSYPELKDRLVQVSERFRDLDARALIRPRFSCPVTARRPVCSLTIR